MAFVQRGEAVMHGMGARQARALEAQAAQEGVGLHDHVHGRGCRMHLGCGLGLPAEAHQQIVAKMRQREGRFGGIAARQVLGAGLAAGIRLEPGCERVAHAGDQEAGRTPGDHFGIHDHQVGVLRQDVVGLEDVVIGVRHRQRTAGRIGRCNGRNDHHRNLVLMGHGLACVDALAAADRQHDVPAMGLDHRIDPVDLLAGALAHKPLKVELDARVRKRLFQVRLHRGVAGFAAQDHGGLAECSNVRADLADSPGALHVLRGRDHDLCHCDKPPCYDVVTTHGDPKIDST